MMITSSMHTKDPSFGDSSSSSTAGSDDLLKMKAWLCGESSKLQFIPILGMGGIGKTTLARKSYDDPLTLDCFDVRVWLTVSQDYSVTELFKTFLCSVKASSKEQNEEKRNETSADLVYKSLKGRKYLIVLDDVWSTKAWDYVKRIVPDDCNGSRIVLTTRQSEVALYVVGSSSRIHHMHLMDEEQSWNLLREKVFGQESCPPTLEHIGKMIAKNCQGLPLAIVATAGLLSRITQTLSSWENIARNVSLAINLDGEQCSTLLSLSYDHLPLRLRKCFLYMGCFSKGFAIRVSKLIKLWVAEGYVEPSQTKSLEEIAEDYLEDLVDRSLVMVTKKSSNDRMRFCTIHDLLKDLCTRKAQEERILRVSDTSVHTFHEGATSCSNILGRSSSIKTILFFKHDATLSRSLKCFRLLKVLDAVRVRFNIFPAEVVELFHLRYLAIAFGFAGRFNLPASISKLGNLQTLIMHPPRFDARCMLSSEIWRMPQLRHLVIFDMSILPAPSKTNGGESFCLENLHTLSRVTNFKFTRKVVKMVPNLKKLGITYSEEATRKGWSKYRLNNLVHLHQLEKLNIYVHRWFTKWNRKPLTPDLLAFPLALKKLTLGNCGIPWKHMGIVGSLPNLEVLKLRYNACRGPEWETTEGEFCRLKTLLIDSTSLQRWIAENSHFPRLERLFLYYCYKLSEIPCDIGEIPTLELIEVDYQNQSIVNSARMIQEEQESLGNDALQVRIRNIYSS